MSIKINYLKKTSSKSSANLALFTNEKFKIDDSLDVFPVHGVGGILGTLLTGIFASNSLGVFSYEQLSRMDSNTAKNVNDALEMLPGKVIEMDWTKQAITMLELKGVDKASSSLIEAESDEVFADLSAARIKWAQIGKAGDRKSDDLTQIKGVDAETQKKLKVLGIRTYEQLSRMDTETAEAVNGALGMMPGRVSKMMWAQQAKALMD